MTGSETDRSDIEAILAKRYDNGADFWTTPDKRLSKGSPFSALESAGYLIEAGLSKTDPVLVQTAELIFSCQKNDGRFRLSPKGAIYPFQTINAANTLCRLGYADDPRLEKTFQHLFKIQHQDAARNLTEPLIFCCGTGR